MKPLDTDKKPAKPAEAAPTAPVVEEKIDFSNVQIEPLFTDLVDFDTFSKSDFRAVKVKECEAVKKSKKLLKFVLDDGTGEDRVILSGIHVDPRLPQNIAHDQNTAGTNHVLNEEFHRQRKEFVDDKDTIKPSAKANLFAFCRGEVSKTKSKIEEKPRHIGRLR